MKLKFVKLLSKAINPKFAHDDDACFDIYAAARGGVNGLSRVYDTGLALIPPHGYNVDLYIRSSLAFKNDFILTNSVAVIDNGYRGSVKVKITYTGNGKPEWPMVGDRIVQGRLVKKIKTDIEEWENEIDETERGEGGFGSTGK